MEIKLTGKNALVGGSSRGIGQAIALRLAASGANVTLMASDLTRLNETLVLLDQSKGQKQQYVKVDFNDFSIWGNETLLFLPTPSISWSTIPKVLQLEVLWINQLKIIRLLLTLV